MRQGGFSKIIDGFGFEGTHFENIFSSMFGGNPFAGSHGRMHQRSNTKSKDPLVQFEIPLSTLKKGLMSKSFRIKTTIKCKECIGKGGEHVERCKQCNGLGNVYMNTRQGNTFFQNISGCHQCSGRGNIITGLCKACAGDGKVVIEEIYDVEIDCKKRKNI